jgi:hypothetical protein
MHLYEWQEDMDMEVGSHSLFQGILLAFAGETEENHENLSQRSQ